MQTKLGKQDYQTKIAEQISCFPEITVKGLHFALEMHVLIPWNRYIAFETGNNT